ncbi:MAG TPA: putative LPS assembly protein LptD [Longimicrobiales bacterium]|nr:putative LPS assembly protein LptD [Longimicrobiales bacterium]
MKLPFIGLIFTLAVPATTAAQQPDTTTQSRAIERLRQRAPLIARDTTPVDTLAQDSLAPPPPQRVELVSDTGGAGRRQAGGWTSQDSIAREFMRLSGYVATEYTAPFARYDADSARLRLEGESSVAREGQVLNADTSIVYYEDTGFACGFGEPTLTGEGLDAPLASDSLCYDITGGVGRAYGLATSVTEQATWFVRGDCWTVTEGGQLYCHDTIFTDCDVEEPHPHYHFRANNVKIQRGNVLVARDVTLHFADVPVFWLPVMMQSLERGRRSGILFPEFGVADIARTSSSYNRRISNVGVFWAINDYMGMRLAGAWESENYSALEMGLDWNVLRRFLRGGLNVSRYWRDTGQRDLTLRANNSWRIDERTNLSLSASYSSSTDLIRNRSYDPEELNRSIDSNFNLTRKFDWANISIGGSRRQQLRDETVTWQAPGLTVNFPTVTLFDAGPGSSGPFSSLTWNGSGRVDYNRTDIAEINPRPVRSTSGISASGNHSINLGGLGVSQSFNVRTHDELGRELPDTLGTILNDTSTYELNWSTTVSYQQRLFAKTTLTPSLNITGHTLGRNEAQMAEPVRLNFGASLGTDLYGFFPGFGPFERLRHRISPTFTYSYSPAPTYTPEQRDFFSVGDNPLGERNTLSISLNQTFEAKYRAVEGEDERAGAAGDTTGVEDTVQVLEPDTTTGPRRREEARIITLLSINTSAVTYDFVRAREDGRGLTNTSISNTLSTDLLSNFTVRISHNLFADEFFAPDTVAGLPGVIGEGRRFAPYLTNMSFGFRLDSDSWIARTLGLGRSRDEDAEPGEEPDSIVGPGTTEQQQAGIEDWNRDGPDAGLIGQAGARSGRTSPADDAVGTWNASFDYVLNRSRPRRLQDGRLTEGNASQTVRGTFRMQPTRNWALSWRTGYDFTEGEFSDHTLTLTRRLHDFDANFDFIKSQNGNFLFMFRAQLRASPDLKVEHTQRDLDPSNRQSR